MSDHAMGSLVLALMLLVLGAAVMGRLFVRLRQPKVVGELMAGIILGPSLLGHFAPGLAASIFARSGPANPTGAVVSFLYQLGLLMLMFLSGSAVRHVLGRENRKATFLILGIGASIPFGAVLALSPILPLHSIAGPAGNHTSVLLIVAIGAAVCSIPFISKIFYDLGIMHTRFASLLLGAAVLEDIALWGVIAISTTIAAATTAGHAHLGATIAGHIAQNLAYFVLAMTVMPALLRRLGNARWNSVARTMPVVWMMAVLFGYVAVAAHFEVTIAWAAFLAGFGIVGGMKGSERHRYQSAINALNDVSLAVFIPLYFALVGYKLDFTKTFSPALLVGFLIGSSVLRIAAVGLASRLAGFRGRPLVNLALTANARGGPGIVLASIAYDAHIIDAGFFTTLVVTAVVTSQLCGFWLDHVLRRGWSLLGTADDDRAGAGYENSEARIGWPSGAGAEAPASSRRSV
jgi:Kef-type K+ transport system membrane component KefB